MKNILGNRFIYFILILLSFILSCQNSIVFKKEPIDENAFVYNMMKDVYLWYDEIPSIDYKSYDSPEELLEAMKYKTDKWSYIERITDTSSAFDFDDAYAFGFISKWFNESTDDTDKWVLRICYVYPGSPAGLSPSITRGDRIKSVNGYALSESSNETDRINIYNYFSSDYLSLGLNDNTADVSLIKALFNLNDSYIGKTFDVNGSSVGYLFFNSFRFTGEFSDTTNSQHQKFNDIFQSFADIDDLIIDLRYNGGGIVDVASYLAGLICGQSFSGEIFKKAYLNGRNYDSTIADYYVFSHNLNNGLSEMSLKKFQPSMNYFIYYIKEMVYSLNLNRVFIITSKNTASASESVINGLKPFIDVVLIGSTSHGKPVGMISIKYKDFLLVPIMFSGFNSLGEGEFFSGFTPTKDVSDDLLHEIGNIDEESIKEALYYIDNGLFTSKKSPQIQKEREFPLQLKGYNQAIGCF